MTLKKHAVLCNGRSGSTYLLGLLNSHPAILNLGEVLGEWTQFRQSLNRSRLPNPSASVILSCAFGSAFRKRGVEALGIKEFFVNLDRFGGVGYFVAHPEISIIWLYRENSLKRLISLKLARMTEKWSTTQESAGRIRINLDCVETIRELDVLQAERERELAILEKMSNAPQFGIKYEDYFSSRERAAEINLELQEFLGVPGQLLSSPYRKILPEGIQDTVENYREIAEALRGSRYETFLD